MQAVFPPTSARQRSYRVYVFDITVIRTQETMIPRLEAFGCSARLANISLVPDALGTIVGSH